MTKHETSKEIYLYCLILHLNFNWKQVFKKNASVQEFYFTMTYLWNQLARTENVNFQAYKPYMKRRKPQYPIHFLWLYDDFEELHGSILHRNLVTSVDFVVSELSERVNIGKILHLLLQF